MLPKEPKELFLEYPIEKRDRILNALACYRGIIPLTPRQVSIASQSNINTVRRYLNGRLLENGFVKRKNGLYEITERGLEQIQYSIRIEERIVILERLAKILDDELLGVSRKREGINQVWVRALEREIIRLDPSTVKSIRTCKKKSNTWDKFKRLLKQYTESVPDFDQLEIASALRYIFARAEKRIPFQIWKERSEEDSS
jgi:predicted transcriptional regulator